MPEIPNWQVKGDWFDACKCNIPCPCSFAQTPTHGDCDGVMVWNIREGKYGDVAIDGLTVVAVCHFEGNAWAGAPVALGIYIDERADDKQREALQMIFGGKAGGWQAQFASLVNEMRGLEFAKINFGLDRDLASWQVEVPGKVTAKGEALTGPTMRPGERAQLFNPPGSEVGPGSVVTWGSAVTNTVDAYGWKWNWAGRSSKHMPFDWTGPEMG